MTWIESHTDVGAHPKTRRLARQLGVSVAAAVGHLHLLWHWAIQYAEDGDLSRHDPEEIAIGAEWEGDASAFVKALITTGFVDKEKGGHRELHDWHLYAGRLIEKRRVNAERMRAARARNVQRTDGTRAGLPTDSTDTPTTTGGGDLKEALIANGISETAVDFAIGELRNRQQAGEEITSPSAWCREVAKNYSSTVKAAARAREPKRLQLADGTVYVVHPDGTREIEDPS